MYECLCVCPCGPYVCMYVCMFVCMYVRVYVCKYGGVLSEVYGVGCFGVRGLGLYQSSKRGFRGLSKMFHKRGGLQHASKVSGFYKGFPKT